MGETPEDLEKVHRDIENYHAVDRQAARIVAAIAGVAVVVVIALLVI